MFLIEGMIAPKELLVLPVALILDFGLGEFSEKVHPTVWMGKIAGKIGYKLRNNSFNHPRLKGALMVFLLVTIFMVPISILSYFLRGFHWLIYISVTAILLKSTFAVSSMGYHIEPIVDSLRAGSLDEARRETSKIVSRDTDELDSEGVTSAAIESTSESITDGIVSPIFFFAIFGLPGAFFYRVVNTLDSMFGYMKDGLVDFGWASANLDTVLNYIPARLTALLVSISACVLGESFRGSLKCSIKEGSKTSSSNAGWPMSAVAGALGIRLKKQEAYELNNEGVCPEESHILKSFGLMRISTLVFSVIVTGLFGLMVLMG